MIVKILKIKEYKSIKVDFLRTMNKGKQVDSNVNFSKAIQFFSLSKIEHL